MIDKSLQAVADWGPSLANLDINGESGKTLIVFIFIGAIAITGIVAGTGSWYAVEKQKQKTKRDLAAYMAEGSISPEDAERIIRAEDATAL